MSEGDEYEGVAVEIIAEKVNSLIDLLDRALAALTIVGEGSPAERLHQRKEIIEACESMGLRLPSVHQLTPEEDAERKRHECIVNGHPHLEVIQEMGIGPVFVQCTHCGETWTLISGDQRAAIAGAQSVLARFETVWENYGGINVKETLATLATIGGRR